MTKNENKYEIELDELLRETEGKITQGKDYYQTEKFPIGGRLLTINFKPITEKMLVDMKEVEEKDATMFILTKTIYSPTNKKLFGKKKVESLLKGKVILAERIAKKIMIESGFDESMLKEVAPFPRKGT